MDIRAYGKDFDKYVDSAKNKYGIKLLGAGLLISMKTAVQGKWWLNSPVKTAA